MAKYQLVDLTTHEVVPGHFVCKGQCPVCKVYWSERKDQSCDCFSSPNAKREDWEMDIRRAVIQAIQALR